MTESRQDVVGVNSIKNTNGRNVIDSNQVHGVLRKYMDKTFDMRFT